MAALKRGFRFSFRTGGDVAGDVHDEIAFHLEMRVKELVDRGLSTDAAWREARRQFGDLRTTAAYCQRLDNEKEKGMRLRRYAIELRQDLGYALRMMVRQPGHAAIALLTIAIGIGATTLVFSVVHASLLAPLPYAHADRLMALRVSLPDYDDVRRSTDIFEDSGVYGSNLYTAADDEQILGGVVSDRFFTTLGVPPQLGRMIDENDKASPVVVISHDLWQSRFGGARDVVGRTMMLSGSALTIVGVMPATFQFPTRGFKLWVNMGYAMTWAPKQTENRSLRIFQVVGRLRPATAPAQAQGQLTALADRLAQAYPDTNTGVTLTLVSIRDRLVGDVRTALLVALGSVACLLFIACANVASLTLARMTTRMQELAVRVAIGAGRWRIARQLAAESILTALCGGALGLVFAWWGLAALPSLIGDRVPRIEQVSLSLPVLGVSALSIILGGLLVAVVPVLQLSMTHIEPALRAGPRGGEMRFTVRLRSALVIVQIGVAVIVLSGALVLGHSFVRLLNADAGIAPDRMLAFNLPLIQQPTPGARRSASTRALESIAALPGVESVGGATGLALVTPQRATTFEVEGRADAPINERRAYFIAASPDYFKTLGTPLVSGREFTASDAETAPPVVVISQTLARRYFPNGDAIGRRLKLINPEQSNDWRTIVGVVADVRYRGLDDVDPPTVYTPFQQTPFPWIYVHVRAHGDPTALIASIRHAVKSVDDRLPVANPQPMTALISQSTADPRFRTTLVALFAVAGMLLAAVGLHGVVAFGVARRTREIAIRLALGASVPSVRWRVIRQSLALALAGVALGLGGAQLLGRVLEGLLYETTPSDPASLAAVAALLVAIAVGASALPARRATRIQPVEALRDV